MWLLDECNKKRKKSWERILGTKASMQTAFACWESQTLTALLWCGCSISVKNGMLLSKEGHKTIRTTSNQKTGFNYEVLFD